MSEKKNDNSVQGSDGEMDTQTLFCDVRSLIEETRTSMAVTVNAGLTLLNWQIGKRIQTEVLNDQRAEYGKQIVATLSQRLIEEYGRGWSARQLRYCLQFVERFPSDKIVNTLCSKLSWSHFRILIAVDDALKRDFYIEMTTLDHWSVRQLRERMNSMLYERTALSRKPEETIAHDLEKLREDGQVQPDMVLKDPYVLDFLNLNDRYYEKDFEDAILRELEQFLLELGVGFTFVSRQKRMSIDDEDFYLDLLFYNRKLKRLVAIDLKIGMFQHKFKSQMELYLGWLSKHELEKGENPPLGLILCAGKKREQVELLELNQSGIHVAEYLTGLPSRKLLEQKLHNAVETAKARLIGSQKKDELLGENDD